MKSNASLTTLTTLEERLLQERNTAIDQLAAASSGIPLAWESVQRLAELQGALQAVATLRAQHLPREGFGGEA